MKKAKRMAICLLLLVLVFSTLTVTALAAEETTPASSTSGSGDIAGLITNTWNAIKGQGKTIVNLAFLIAGGIMTLWAIGSLSTCAAEYHKCKHIEAGPVVLKFAIALIFFTAPLYIWGTIGW